MFDQEIILELMELAKETDPAMVDQLVGNFRRSAPVLISEIQAAYAGNNLDVLEKSSHKLKGSAGMIGLLDLAQTSSSIMTAARNKQKPSEMDVQSLEKIFQTNLAELTSFIDSHRD